MPNDTQWHLDKRVTLSLLAAVVMQCALVIWWANQVDSSVSEHERRLQRIEAQRISERLTALESQMVDVRGSLMRIEGKLDRLIETRSARP